MRIFLTIILFFILTLCHLYSQTPYVVNIDKSTYEAANKNWSIDQDENGTVYFANDAGLLEFDGIKWKLYQLPKTSIIRSITVIDHNTICTGAYEEFGIWKRDISGTLQYTSLSASLPQEDLKDNEFWKIKYFNNTIYFQSFGSIYGYNSNQLKLIVQKSLLFLSQVRDELWIQEIQGSLYKLTDDKLIKIEGSDIFKNKDVRVILPYKTNQYLIGTSNDGLYIYDNKTFQSWDCEASNLFRTSDLNCGLLSVNHTYWFGTIVNGLYQIDLNGNVLEHFSTETTLQNNTILGLQEDDLGNLWVALDKGISYVQYLHNMSCHIDPNGTLGAVYDATLWNDKLILATNQGVFTIQKSDMNQTNSFADLKLINGTEGQTWRVSVIDDKLYCSHNKGLKVINQNMTMYQPYSINTGLYSIQETQLKEQDVLLFSTYNQIRLLDRSTKQIYNLNTESSLFTEIDHLGNIWSQHPMKGVDRYMLEDDLHTIKNVSSFGGDNSDDLPFRLSMFKIGGRIILFGNNHFYSYDEIDNQIRSNDILNNCLKEINEIQKIIHIKADTFLALAHNIIIKFKYDGYSANIEESYDIQIHKLSMVDGYENIAPLNDSLSLICLDNGFLLYQNEHNKKTNLGAPDIEKPYFKFIQTSDINNNFNYNEEVEAKIPYQFNTLTFGFSAKDFFSKNLYFQYKLEGVDKNWSAPYNQNQITYQRLPPGKYTFQIRTIDNLGHNSDVKTYYFEICSPWYLTFWAYIVYFLLFILITYFIWSMILKRYRNIHLQKIRQRETRKLQFANQKLQAEIQTKNAELFTQTSFIIQKNELILKIKEIVDEFYENNKIKQIEPFYRKIDTLLSNTLDTEDDWRLFLIQFEQRYPDFFNTLKKEYPQLTINDLKLCACLKLNLDSKEIAAFMNLSVRAIENARYRLRKKINLAAEQKLSDFFLSI